MLQHKTQIAGANSGQRRFVFGQQRGGNVTLAQLIGTEGAGAQNRPGHFQQRAFAAAAGAGQRRHFTGAER
ncbi:hypothetical protein D3C80_1865420 [compost metagenome]